MLNFVEIDERDRRKVDRFLVHGPTEELAKRFEDLDGTQFKCTYGGLVMIVY